MRQAVVWIMLGMFMGAGLSLTAGTGKDWQHTPARSVLPAEDNCTALALDRITGRTVAVSCRKGEPIRLEAGLHDRQHVRI